MTSHDINLNYQEALKQANQLRAHADDLREAYNDYNNSLADLESAWQGPEAQKFISSAHVRAKKLTQTATLLDNTAQAIEKTAALFQRAELQKLQAQSQSH